jgi:hypothetical protein
MRYSAAPFRISSFAPSRPRVSIIARLLHTQHRPLLRVVADLVSDPRGVTREHIAASTLC